MAIVEELLRAESNGAIGFGNHTLGAKAKKEDFQYEGDSYKVKTYQEITKLEKNEMFLYESVPGTSVTEFKEDATGVSFIVEGDKDAQITIGLADETEYEVYINDSSAGIMKTHFGGKLSLSVELAGAGEVKVNVKKA